MKRIQYTICCFLFFVSTAWKINAQSTTFNHTGASQTYTVPACVSSITIDARGGAGGGSGTANIGGNGGRLQATIPVVAGEVLNIYVGGAATSNAGGWNGGGNGGPACAGGGGASDIRQGGSALSNRVIVAGGGGGAGLCSSCTNNVNGGPGGGMTGAHGWYISQGSASTGKGGTQSFGGAGGTEVSSGSSGSLGAGGNGGGTYGGGGGAGYYGGGGAATNVCCWGGGGGGGSSYAISTASGVIHTQGFQSGNGQIVITPNVSTGPAAPGTITGSVSVCQGSSQTYSISSVSGATSYNWTLPGGWTGSSTSNSITAIAGATGGNITVTASNSCGTSSQATLTVSINTPPATPGTISGSTTVCEGTSQTYSVSPVSGATSYSWTLPGGWTGSSATASVTAIAGATGGDITVVASNSCGTSTAVSLTVSVITPPAAPGVISGSTTVCEGSSQTYSVSPVSGATSYNWTLPGGWTGTSTTNSLTATIGAASGNITVAASNSCGTSSEDSVTVSVNTSPATPGAISGSNSVCEGTAQTYSVSPVSGSVTYLWTLPADWTGSSASNSILVNTGAMSGNITVSASNTCGTSADAIIAVTTASIPPMPASITGDTSVCEGSSQTYAVSVVSGASSYVWVLPVGWSGTSTTNSITATAGGADSTISVAASNGCGTGPAQTINIDIHQTVTYSQVFDECQGFSVTVGTNTYTATGLYYDVLTAINGCDSVVFTDLTINLIDISTSTTANTITANASGATYQWIDCDDNTAIVGETSQSYTVASTGNYAVEIMQNGCTDTSACQNIVSVGIAEFNNGKAGIYPNPTAGMINVQFNSMAVRQLQVLNTFGQLLFEKQSDEKNTTIDLSHVSAGIYFLLINENGRSERIRFVKE